jgi:stage III sporulation protein SpoIIIAA
MTQDEHAREIGLLLDVLPTRLMEAISGITDRSSLVEIVLDLGRPPEALTYQGRALFDDLEVTYEDLGHVIDHIGEFGDDNRAGIARTLHRISAIRNRTGRVIGLTLRVGRAVHGTVEPVRDVIESGQSVLLLGRPGVGKTTMLRETARIIAETRRVIVVDTSNEIAGDGDIPHPAIGRARRMQVATPSLQHEVMIEAVENHNPEVIIIDEIGRELEASAARTIAERGVQLVATAHGNTLQNLLQNPTLSDLVGGLESVTLSDEEARRRGTQKSVLERKAPPTFAVVVEIKAFDRVAIHHEVTAAVDSLLRGRPLDPEVRYRDADGDIHVEPGREPAPRDAPPPFAPVAARAPRPSADTASDLGPRQRAATREAVKVFAYGVSQSRLRQTVKSLGVPMILTDDLAEAQAVLTLKSYYRRRAPVIGEAEARRIPVYVLRSNTSTQIENALSDLFHLEPSTDGLEAALDEATSAIRTILVDGRDMVELGPRIAPVRRRQHDLAREANLLSVSSGREPYRRVRIFRNAEG